MILHQKSLGALFYTPLHFIFLLLLGMVMYDEFETIENKIFKPQHMHHETGDTGISGSILNLLKSLLLFWNLDHK